MTIASLTRTAAATALVATLTLGATEPAQAGVDIEVPNEGRRAHLLDLHGGFAPAGMGIAVGVRYGIPLIPNGPIKSINNAFFLSIGGDVYFADYANDGGLGLGIGIPVMVHWQFYFDDHWSAFGELGVNILFDDNFFQNGDFIPNAGWIGANIGGNYYFNKDFGLVLRLGMPYISFGVQWAL